MVAVKWWEMRRTDSEWKVAGFRMHCISHGIWEKDRLETTPQVFGLRDYCHFLRRVRVSKERSEVKGQKFSFGEVRRARCDRLLEIQVRSSGKRFMLDIKYGNKLEDSAVIWIYKLLNTCQQKFLEGKLGKIQKGQNDGPKPEKFKWESI